MHLNLKSPAGLLAIALLAAAPGASLAQDQSQPKDVITVTGTAMPDPATLTKGADIKGVITARNDDKIKVVGADGTVSIITVTDTTKVKAGGGLFGGGAKLDQSALLNGLPVTVKTLRSTDAIYAAQVTFKNGDYKTAQMIHNGTAQQFAEQTAATQALRSRVGDIDNYNIKGTTNVYFDTGSSRLSQQAKSELCGAANQAEGMNNALMLVVGYTDSVGSDEYNQGLSERRAGSVINYLQQVCHWKPYRMMTPTGMAEADPLADNSTPQGKAQNRRVAVNILVSKGLDGM